MDIASHNVIVISFILDSVESNLLFSVEVI